MVWGSATAAGEWIGQSKHMPVETHYAPLYWKPWHHTGTLIQLWVSLDGHEGSATRRGLFDSHTMSQTTPKQVCDDMRQTAAGGRGLCAKPCARRPASLQSRGPATADVQVSTGGKGDTFWRPIIW